VPTSPFLSRAWDFAGSWERGSHLTTSAMRSEVGIGMAIIHLWYSAASLETSLVPIQLSFSVLNGRHSLGELSSRSL
jgi:hypothetical protein